MATGESILKKMHEYEAKVLTALGYKPDDPVVSGSVTIKDGWVSFRWVGPGDPPPPRHGFGMVDAVLGEPLTYSIHCSAMAPGVWNTILAAVRDWESNFPAVNHG